MKSPSTLVALAAGPLVIADGLSVPQFVEKAFNDELKHAGLYSEGGTELKGELTRIGFSSTAAVVNGWWEPGLALQSSNGKSMTVEVHHDFDAGFNGYTVYEGDVQIGQARYDARAGGANMSKFGPTTDKISGLVDELFAKARAQH